MEKNKHLGLRIDDETHKKLKSLAEFNGRSINSEVIQHITVSPLRGIRNCLDTTYDELLKEDN